MARLLLLMVKLFAVVSCLPFRTKPQSTDQPCWRFKEELWEKGEDVHVLVVYHVLWGNAHVWPFVFGTKTGGIIRGISGSQWSIKPSGRRAFSNLMCSSHLERSDPECAFDPPSQGGGRRPNPVEPPINRAQHQRLQHLPCYIRIGTQCNDV